MDKSSNLNINSKPIDKQVENIYEACVVISKRARQINQAISNELRERLGNIETEEDLNEESIDRESLITGIEKQEKSTTKAVNEMMESKIRFEYMKDKHDKD